ncbi:signal peptide peptidase SppA, 67K type [Mizugakiibacter sediminis]|uniref:Endopeptidase IV n=1 Tax=Mizugakiibacter sediminis TaxID=1475481 RepID=A0A0K8QKM7_9GAMM|nr:signal peptide peptidase SppA [Mizugakiibacter sediminis]GAP65216.1 signal peptide peptidase SppA, 67K type [Mizugakiibacter sediminis]
MTERGSSGFLGVLRALWRGLDFTRRLVLNLVFFVLLLGFLAVVMRSAPRVEPDSVLVLKPEGMLVEQYSIDPMERALARLGGDTPKQVQVRDLVGAIDAAARDPRIKRILLQPDELAAGGFAALREVGAALDRFRAGGKQVIAWAGGYTQSQYYLAAHADRVLLDPEGGVLLQGLASYRNYYRELLDRLGVDVHLFRVGEFKSAAEPFILNQASPEAKEADSYWLGGLWDTYLDEVAQRRRLDPAALRATVAQLPQEIAAAQGDLAALALRLKLVDGLATHAELSAMLRREGAPDRDGHGFRHVAFDDYLASLRAQALEIGKPRVAVVVAEGEIVGGKQPPGMVGGDSTAALLRQAREDRNVKAVVLRVDSPGGEVYAAEQIRREVALTRAAGKPVIVSMGDVAASGGYWIAMNADRILAEPNTITGSIGIFGLFFNVPDTLAKIGVHTDGVGTSPWAGAFDVRRPLDPAVGQVIQSVIDKGYRDFTGKVAAARGTTVEAIDAVARGRVWTGKQALQRGLVDQLGGLDDAVRLAAERAKLGRDYAVSYVERPLGALDRFLLDFSQSTLASWVRASGVALPHWLVAAPRLAPELALFRHARAGMPQVYAYCFCTP